MVRALSDTLKLYGVVPVPAVLVHGNCRGADMMADGIWREWCAVWPDLFLPPESYPGEDFPSFAARNQHMVDLGADHCVAFAASWESGTGQCARMARKAGIPTTDFGVSTERRAA